MTTIKLRIMARACKIRLEAGETLDAILESYPKLTAEDKAQIRAELGSND